MNDLIVIDNTNNKVIIVYGENRAIALEQLQIILMDRLSFSSNYNLHFIDLYGRGACLGIFNNDAVENEKYGFYTYTSKKELSDFFKKIEDHISAIGTKIGPLSDIYEFNQACSQKIKETIIVLYDFPYGITDEDITKIELISNQAQRCGLYIYVLTTYNLTKFSNEFTGDFSFFNDGWSLIQVEDHDTAHIVQNIKFDFPIRDKSKLIPGMVVSGQLIQAQAFSSICSALSRMVLTFKISDSIEGTCFIDYTTPSEILNTVSSLQKGDIAEVEILSISNNCIKVVPIKTKRATSSKGDYYQLKNYDKHELLSRLVDYKAHFDANKKIDTNYSNYCSLDESKVSDSTNGIHLPIMVEMNNAHKVDCLTIGVSLYRHALITGSTSAGKSTFLHTIINFIISSYSPSDVELWLVDYAKVEFNRYYDNTPPHIRFLGLESNRDFTYSFVAYIKKIFDERQELFAKANVKNIEEYKRKFGKNSLSRIVLIIDEFHRMTQALHENSSYAQFLENALTEYRKYGLTCIFSNQTICGLIGLTETAEKQISVRIAMSNTEDEMLSTLKIKSSEIDSDILLRMKNSTIGDLWIADINDEIHHQIKGYKAIWMNDEQIDCCIKNAISRYQDWDYSGTIKIAKIQRDRFPAQAVLEAAHNYSDSLNIPIYMGSSFTVEKTFSIVLKRKYDENILACGKNIDLIFDIFRTFVKNFSAFGATKKYVFTDSYSPVLLKLKQGRFDRGTEVEVIDDLSKMCRVINDIERHVSTRRPFEQNIVIFWFGFSSLLEEFRHSPSKEEIKNLNTELVMPKEHYSLGQIMQLAQEKEIMEAARNSGMSVQDYLSMYFEESSAKPDSTLETDQTDFIYNAEKDVEKIIADGSRLGCFNFIHFDSPYEMERIREIGNNNFSHKILTQMSQPEMREFGVTSIDYDDYKIDGSTALYIGETKIKFCPYIFD